MKIILCPSFLKQLAKIKSVNLDNVKELLRGYPRPEKIRHLDQVEDTEVLKCYLFNKKVRSIMFLRTESNSFIPIAITRKETKKGKNIIKENYQELFKGEIRRIREELAENNYKVEDL